MPEDLRFWFPGHEVRTVRYMRWRGNVNGALLALARDEFDVVVTRDGSIPYQQRITGEDVAVVILDAKSNEQADLEPLIPRVLDILTTLNRGDVVWVSGD